MKKTALAVVVTGALGVSAANAATVTEFANGVLVPRVITNQADPGVGQTAIGLSSCAAGTVYWTFYDVNSNHVLDDQFDMTENDLANLVWNVTNNPGSDRLFGDPILEGTEGYMTFILDTTGNVQLEAIPGLGNSSDEPCLAGAAFQVHLGDGDVAFVPTMPLNIRPVAPGVVAGDFDEEGGAGTGIFIDDLVAMDGNDVARLTAGAGPNDMVYMRYFIDGAAGGDDTAIYVWSTSSPGADITVQAYDDDQERRSINISFPNAELNTIDPETLPIPFTDGFILMPVPASVAGLISWSVIESPAFGARQTIVNPIRLLDGAGNSAFRVRVVESDTGGVVPGHTLELATE
jgi:hypothetical protein